MAYDKKKKKRRNLRGILLVSLLAAVLLFALASTVGRRDFGFAHRLTFELVGSGQGAVTRLRAAVGSLWGRYINLVHVRDENLRLRREIERYKAVNAEFREAVATNVRLRKLLDLQEQFPTPTLAARIIGRDPSLWFKTMTIDRGSVDGVEKGMPAVTFSGVVGQVVNVAPHHAKVLLAIDPTSALDALVQKNRTQGIIKGSGSGYRLEYVLKNSDVAKGDAIVTSGMSGVFPKGLPIGTVAAVIKTRRGMFQKIEVAPAVNFRDLEYVTILLTPDPLAE